MVVVVGGSSVVVSVVVVGGCSVVVVALVVISVVAVVVGGRSVVVVAVVVGVVVVDSGSEVVVASVSGGSVVVDSVVSEPSEETFPPEGLPDPPFEGLDPELESSSVVAVVSSAVSCVSPVVAVSVLAVVSVAEVRPAVEVMFASADVVVVDSDDMIVVSWYSAAVVGSDCVSVGASKSDRPPPEQPAIVARTPAPTARRRTLREGMYQTS